MEVERERELVRREERVGSVGRLREARVARGGEGSFSTSLEEVAGFHCF